MSTVLDAVKNLKAFEAKIITKALSDADFRAKLLSDPKSAVESEAGKDIPEGLNIKIIEEEPGTLTLILPPSTEEAESEGELSDAALDQAAGGTDVGIAADFLSRVCVGCVASV